MRCPPRMQSHPTISRRTLVLIWFKFANELVAKIAYASGFSFREADDAVIMTRLALDAAKPASISIVTFPVEALMRWLGMLLSAPCSAGTACTVSDRKDSRFK